MRDGTFFVGSGFEVNATHLRTPRKTFALKNIEFVAVERPLLFFVIPPAIGLIGFAAMFRRYLYAGEIATLTVACLLAIVVAFLFGTLKVHSLALRDAEVASSLGLVSTLRQVRRAVEQAMALRDHEQRVDV